MTFENVCFLMVILAQQRPYLIVRVLLRGAQEAASSAVVSIFLGDHVFARPVVVLTVA
jgi:hypothetical protein